LLAAGAALAQGSPRPLKIVVPFGAGTSTDIVGRILADALGRQLGVAAIVENKPGAGGSIGSEQVARATDGQTLLMGTVGTHAINPSLYKRLPYQPLRDFVPLGFAGATPTLLVVPANSPWKSVADLGAATGNVNFASAGNGTSGHLAGELFNVRLAKNFMHVPYRDGAQAMTELMAGNVQFMFYHPAAVMPQVRAGKLRALAVTGDSRSPAMPDVPTIDEAGVKNAQSGSWTAVLAPAGTPPAVIEKLSQAIRDVANDPAIKTKLESQGAVAHGSTPQQLQALAASERARYGQIIKTRNIQTN